MKGLLRFLTAGESHGMGLVGIIEGLPAGLALAEREINSMLQRRQKGYGRGTRMKMETDKIRFLAGLYKGVTIGSPLALYIENKDWANWKDKERTMVRIPRPGHADLAGAFKYGFDDIQRVIERASARETAIRTSIGAVAKKLLAEFDIEVIGHVIRIGKICCGASLSLAQVKKGIKNSPVFCCDPKKSELMCREIDRAKSRGETLGGIFEVLVTKVPPGLGSYVHWDKRLDGRLAKAILSIPSVKGVEVGEAIENSQKYGSEVHDQIFIRKEEIYRKTNRAGGIEGGVSNGEIIRMRGFVKPIPTLGNLLDSVDLWSKKGTKAPLVRSDICVVPAISVIGEAVVAWGIAESFAEKFGGDSLKEMKRNYKNYMRGLVR
ncbi:MAG: chorismate synthase [Candidatus Zixiibacteriota bacterium]